MPNIKLNKYNHKDSVLLVKKMFPDDYSNRTARLEIRCKPELKEVISEPQQLPQFNGYTVSDIIHFSIQATANFNLWDASKEINKKIDTLV